MAKSEQLLILKKSINEWNQWREYNPFLEVDLSNANLNSANLSNANLSNANLSSANLSNANLSNANLSSANLSNANLSNALLEFTNCSYSNFQEAYLINSKVLGCNFDFANLKYANLTNSKVLGCNFEKAILTGICLEINEDYDEGDDDKYLGCGSDFDLSELTYTYLEEDEHEYDEEPSFKLKNIICDYFYLRYNPASKNSPYYGRIPEDEDLILAENHFQRIFEKRRLINLVFTGGIDWKVFIKVFYQLKKDFKDDILVLHSLQNEIDYSQYGDFLTYFIIVIEISSRLNPKIVEESFWKYYQLFIEVDDNYRNRDAKVKRHQDIDIFKIVEEFSKKDSISSNNKFESIVQTIQNLINQYSNDFSIDSYSQKMAIAAKIIEKIEKEPLLKKKVILTYQQGLLYFLESHPIGIIVLWVIKEWKL